MGGPWEMYKLCAEHKTEFVELTSSIGLLFKSEMRMELVELKGMGRVLEKYFFKYGRDARRIRDILRCSYVCNDIATLYETLREIIKYVRKRNREDNCVWVKDRFHPDNRKKDGYRDL